jgi:hypothetical protein
MQIRIANIIKIATGIALILSLSSMAQYGGRCAYTIFPGTATIVDLVPVEKNSEYFEPYFRFQPDAAIDTVLVDTVLPLSIIYNIADIIDKLYIKQGHSYPCTLSGIKTGTCSPRIFTIGAPASWAGYDTSRAWTCPDTVDAGQTFSINLFDYDFDCTYSFSNITSSIAGDSIFLGYFGESLLDVICLKGACLRGVRFDLSAAPAARYPVISNRLPACYPCRMANTVTCIDTLTVTASSSGRSPLFITMDSPNIRAVLWPRGKVCIDWNPPIAGTYAIRLLDISGRIIWQGEKRIPRAGRARTEISLGTDRESAGIFMLEISPINIRTGATSSIAGGFIW